MAFTHLHVRSSYSLMDSTITIDKLIDKAKKLQFDGLALTDEHVLYGVIPFYKACVENGIKPIIGMTVFVEQNENMFELVLLAKNNKGYQSLTRLSSQIQLNQQKVISIEKLSGFTNDLIGILPTNNPILENLLIHKSHEEINQYLRNWLGLFQRDDFYLGVQPDEQRLFLSLKSIQDLSGISVVSLCDVRYLDEKDDMAFDILQSMKKGKQWDMKLSSPNVKRKHLRSSMEMEQIFQNDWPEVLQETEIIKNKCHVSFDFNQKLLPSFPLPENIKADQYLEKLCWENVGKKYTTVTDVISQRLAYEIQTIQKMKFSDYFLIVADFIWYAKENNILVGPGRGSSAGSLVAYLLGITDVDPIKYNLIFERFLNPERKTMPDIDVDFSDERRDEVIEYVRNKYGVEHVAQIITFGTFAHRSLIRELMKTLNVEQQDMYYILNKLPQQSSKKLSNILKESEELNEYIKSSKKLKILFTAAIKLEGIPRHISTHAAGVVISNKPLLEHVPLTIGTNETRLTQFTMNDLESLGLLKMDFLGLRNLSFIEKILRSIHFTEHIEVTLDQLPEHDQKTYSLLRSGKTNGIFQLESQGMKRVLTELKPDSFEDIVAVNALFRPGPMDFIPVYIARKEKREPIQYPHPDLEPILKPTYGVLVYQEQIMQIANKIAGFSLGEADILRRAVSKKKQQVMEEQKEAFIEGCIRNGYEKIVANEIFSWIVKFSNYGFPRSHAVAYSKISYYLSYLKAHYPANFFAELLNSFGNQQEKWNLYLKEIREINITILPPSINKSYGRYSVENGQIRIGLAAIKGVGNQAIKEIINVRKNGAFKHLYDFCLRVDLKLVNRQTMENLIMAGVFDDSYSNRASLLASLDRAREQGELFSEFSSQSSFFQDELLFEMDYVQIEDFSIAKKLADEKELIGTFVSSHPLKELRPSLRGNGYITMREVQRFIGKRRISSAVLVQSLKTIRTKRGDPMAFLVIGDETGEVDAVVFPELYRNINQWLKEELMITVKGKVEYRNNKLQWVLEDVQPFSENQLDQKSSKIMFVKVTPNKRDTALQTIQQIANKYPGSTSIIIYHEETKRTYQLSQGYNIHANYDSLKALRHFFGNENVVLKNN
ncbi:DNA polymerase III subunit alpha [Bacilli bacterium]|nr:DNA polymerase III subunit alpha [Bacilli bacterium VT-13-104]PZD86256.1 DNA polymerase III subunit alpha [Bacilli bacterium]PZD87103.1 DNA polymerase III subunit alpha [Bacilli bacterium]PZD90330.1 DNA polymerase III subunit alpha [Bacilli bacterium]RCO06216.1 DNA polymerase III subunit alpha [Bacilli bacterium]